MALCPKCRLRPRVEGQGYCPECNRQQAKDYYYAHKGPYIERAKAQIRSKKALVASLKNKPCADCERQFPFWAMQFDHLRDKVETLSFMGANNRTVEQIQAEAAKCEVVCVLCHRHRTYSRGKYPLMTDPQKMMIAAWGSRLKIPMVVVAPTLPAHRSGHGHDGPARYQANKQRMNGLAVFNLRRRRFELATTLKSGPCATCRRYFPPWMMDFDHRDFATKEAPLAKFLAEARMTPQLEAELAKCDLVCAVCHGYRTSNRAGRLTADDRSFHERWLSPDF